MKVCVLIPTYKEYENLKKLIPYLYEKVYPKMPNVTWSTLVVDDNSSDGTKQLLSGYKKKYTSIRTLYGEKKGIGAAMKRGYVYAIEKIKPDYIATLEADYVVRPKELIKMVSLAKKYDVILAKRNNQYEYYESDTLRLFAHILINHFICTKLSAMSNIHEHTAACRIINIRTILPNIYKIDDLPNGYAFFPAFLYFIALETRSFCEYETPFHKRKVGMSKMSVTKYKNMLVEMRDYIRWALWYRKNLQNF